MRKTDKRKKQWVTLNQDCQYFCILYPPEPSIREEDGRNNQTFAPLYPLHWLSFHSATSQPIAQARAMQTDSSSQHLCFVLPKSDELMINREDLPTFSLDILPGQTISSKRDCCDVKVQKKTRNVKWSGNRGN